MVWYGMVWYAMVLKEMSIRLACLRVLGEFKDVLKMVDAVMCLAGRTFGDGVIGEASSKPYSKHLGILGLFPQANAPGLGFEIPSRRVCL